MRRGFYGWDETELPLPALEARKLRLQGAMRADNFDALLLYTNIARPAAVSWLTGFTPYWSEGLLLVPREGDCEFITALSNRVAEWMRAVTPTGSILCTPQPAKHFGERLAQAGAKRLGVLELDMLSGGLASALLAAAPGLQLVDATQCYSAARAVRDDAERSLFARAGEIAQSSFAAIAGRETAAPFEAMGALEKAARDQRAEEVFVTLAPDLGASANFVRVDRAPVIGASFALRASVAYKSAWVRRTRSFSIDPRCRDLFARLDESFEACVGSLDAGSPIATQISAAFAAHSGARLAHWSIEGCRASYPLEFLAGDSEAAGAPLSLDGCVLCAELQVGNVRWLGQAPIGSQPAR